MIFHSLVRCSYVFVSPIYQLFCEQLSTKGHMHIKKYRVYVSTVFVQGVGKYPLIVHKGNMNNNT